MKVTAARKVSVLLGAAAQAIIMLWYLAYLSSLYASGLLVAFLGIGHFYLMEVDYKGIPKVRPFGWLPFLLAAAVACLAMIG